MVGKELEPDLGFRIEGWRKRDRSEPGLFRLLVGLFDKVDCMIAFLNSYTTNHKINLVCYIIV